MNETLAKTARWLCASAALAAGSAAASSTPDGGTPVTMTLTSPAFRAGGEIPSQYTCEGKNLSPPLEWSGVPAAAKSLALVVDDPDAPDPKAPKMTYVHWVLVDLPPAAKGLAEAVLPADLPKGARAGLNDWKRPAYGGPCPPIGRHRYFFKLYALDAPLASLGSPTKAELEKAMEGHVLARAELIGTYEKKRPRL